MSEITFRVSVKGAISVYGLQRFPVTLYASQWRRIFENQAAIEQFIRESDHLLKRTQTDQR